MKNIRERMDRNFYRKGGKRVTRPIRGGYKENWNRVECKRMALEIIHMTRPAIRERLSPEDMARLCGRVLDAAHSMVALLENNYMIEETKEE
jgi:hypothetical protein